MTQVLLHIGDSMPSAADAKSVRALAGALGGTLHVIFTVVDPLSAGWQAEVDTAGVPEVHQAMEAEARDRLRPIFGEDADTPTIQIRTGDPIRAIADYANEAQIDLIVVGLAGDEEASLASSLLDAAPCSVLAWKRRK